MAKFVFRMQPLLNVKLQLEENKKNELAFAMQAVEKQKELLKGIENEREANIKAFGNESGQGTTVEKLKEFTAYLSLLKEKTKQQKENVKLAEVYVDKIRVELIEIVQQRETYEKLKEKKFEQYRIEQLKEEEKLVDEVVSYKHNNKDMGEFNGKS